MTVYAQESSNDCGETLKQAYAQYELGQLTQSIESLQGCLEHLPKDVVFEAYRLMALASMSLGDYTSTDKYIVQLLKHKPEYKTFPFFDPVEFTRLLEEYDVWPKFVLGAKWGLNSTSIHAIKNYSLTNSEATYLPGTGFNVGLSLDYYFLKHTAINTEALFSRINYSRTAKDVIGWEQVYQERISFFDIPISIRHYLYQGQKLKIGAEFGFQLSILNSTNSNISFTHNTTEERIQRTYQASESRAKAVYYTLAGLTAKYPLGEGQLGLNVRYAYGLNNVNIPDNRYNDLNFAYTYVYVDSDFRFNPLSIGLTYSFPLQNSFVIKKK